MTDDELVSWINDVNKATDALMKRVEALETNLEKRTGAIKKLIATSASAAKLSNFQVFIEKQIKELESKVNIINNIDTASLKAYKIGDDLKKLEERLKTLESKLAEPTKFKFAKTCPSCNRPNSLDYKPQEKIWKCVWVDCFYTEKDKKGVAPPQEINFAKVYEDDQCILYLRQEDGVNLTDIQDGLQELADGKKVPLEDIKKELNGVEPPNYMVSMGSPPIKEEPPPPTKICKTCRTTLSCQINKEMKQQCIDGKYKWYLRREKRVWGAPQPEWLRAFFTEFRSLKGVKHYSELYIKFQKEIEAFLNDTMTNVLEK